MTFVQHCTKGPSKISETEKWNKMFKNHKGRHKLYYDQMTSLAMHKI